MICRIVFGAIVVLTATAAAGAVEADSLLDGTRVVPIEITLPAVDWETLRRESRGPMGLFAAGPSQPFTYHRGHAVVDGLAIADVGVRKKGFFGSIDSVRPSLIVDFNRYVPQQPIDGIGRLTLNNNKQDTSCVGQYLAYTLFRAAGVPAARAGFASVTVNGEGLGIYTLVEPIKKPFLARAFGDSAGSLYEGTVADLVPESLGKLEVETHDRARPQLEELAALLAADGPLDLPRVEQLVDVEQFLSYWAVEAIIGMWDGYTSNQNNYFLYADPRDTRLRFIPWGADSAFTPIPALLPGFGRGPAPAIYAQAALANRLIFTPGLAARYRQRLEGLLATVWNEDNLVAEVDRLELLLMPHVAAAQRNATTSLAAVRGFIRHRRGELSKALASWPPELPERYRQPMTTRRVGTVSGSFATIQRDSATGDSAPGEIALSIRLNGTAVAFEPTGVAAYPLPIPGPQGQAMAPATPPRTPEGPIGVTISGTRPTGSPLTLTFMLDRRLLRDTTAGVATGGMLTEGTGFFGTGPMRIVGGTAALTDRGSDPGSRLGGTFEFTVDETSGGFTNPAAKRRPIDTSRDDPDATVRNNP